MTDNLILSSIFHFLLNFQQSSQWGIDITPPLFLNYLPLPFHSSAVTPPLRILARFFNSHCLTCDGKMCCSIITISSSLNVLWHQFKTLTPLEFPHNMQSHVLRIPEILYSIKTRLLLIKSALTFIFYFSSHTKNLYLETLMSFYIRLVYNPLFGNKCQWVECQELQETNQRLDYFLKRSYSTSPHSPHFRPKGLALTGGAPSICPLKDWRQSLRGQEASEPFLCHLLFWLHFYSLRMFSFIIRAFVDLFL